MSIFIDRERIKSAIGPSKNTKEIKENKAKKNLRELPLASKSRRIQFGIPGLDALVKDGVPSDSSILISGVAGTGKSILALQSIYYSALKYGERSVYITTDESIESIRKTGELFGWNIASMEKKNMIRIIFKDIYEIKNFSKSLAGDIYYNLKEIKATRMVLDSVSQRESCAGSEREECRKLFSDLVNRLKSEGCASFVISDIPFGSSKLSANGFEEFIVDGIILLHRTKINNRRERAIEILKMRHTRHDNMLHPFEIGPAGIVIYSRDHIRVEPTDTSI